MKKQVLLDQLSVDFYSAADTIVTATKEARKGSLISFLIVHYVYKHALHYIILFLTV